MLTHDRSRGHERRLGDVREVEYILSSTPRSVTSVKLERPGSWSQTAVDGVLAFDQGRVTACIRRLAARVSPSRGKEEGVGVWYWQSTLTAHPCSDQGRRRLSEVARHVEGLIAAEQRSSIFGKTLSREKRRIRHRWTFAVRSCSESLCLCHVVNLIPGVWRSLSLSCCSAGIQLKAFFSATSLSLLYTLYGHCHRSSSSNNSTNTQGEGVGESTLPVDILETATTRPGESRSTCQSTVTPLRRNLYTSTKPDLFTRPIQPSHRGRISTYSLITTRYTNTRARGTLPLLHALDEWDSGEEKRCV